MHLRQDPDLVHLLPPVCVGDLVLSEPCSREGLSEGMRGASGILRPVSFVTEDAAGVGPIYFRVPDSPDAYFTKCPLPVSRDPAAVKVARKSPIPPPLGPAPSDPIPVTKFPERKEG